MALQDRVLEQTRIFNISSSSADIMTNDTYLSNGIWTIPNFIMKDENVSHIYFSILHAEIPVSFYLINEYNNILAITVSGTTTYYTITQGNYNINQLIAAINTLTSNNYIITFSNLTNKLTIKAAFSFTINAVGSTITRILGLSATTNLEATLISSLYTLVLPNCISLFPTARLNFRSVALNLDNYHSNDRSSDVFLSLQNNANINGMILYENNNNLKHYLEIDYLNQLDIRITDDQNRLLNFNNCAWFLTLRIDTHYYNIPKGTNFSKIIKSNNNLLVEYFNNLADSEAN